MTVLYVQILMLPGTELTIFFNQVSLTKIKGSQKWPRHSFWLMKSKRNTSLRQQHTTSVTNFSQMNRSYLKAHICKGSLNVRFLCRLLDKEMNWNILWQSLSFKNMTWINRNLLWDCYRTLSMWISDIISINEELYHVKVWLGLVSLH